MHSILLTGKVTRSEIRFLADDSTPLCELTVEFQYDRQKTTVRESVRVEAWNGLAQTVYDQFSVGSLILVDGRPLVNQNHLVIRARSIQPAYPDQTVNQMVIVSYAGNDPELKDLPESNSKVASVSVAINRTQSEQDITDWYSLECWNRTAEIAAQYVHKGSLVGAIGQLTINRWQTQEGEARMRPTIRVDRLELLGGKRESEGETPVPAETTSTAKAKRKTVKPSAA